MLVVGLAVLLSACRSDDVPVVGSGGGERRAELTLELTIGDDPAAAPEYQFAEISSIYVAHDGTVWATDAANVGFASGNPQVRIFDAAGGFVRYVGGEGDGPGEFRRPYGIAELPDGRVAVRDVQVPGRVLLYSEGGNALATWTPNSLGTGALTGIYRGRDPIRVDSAGVVWLFTLDGRPSLDQEAFYVRVHADGVVVDTVRLPATPEVERDELRIERTLPSGGRSVRGFTVPYQPFGAFTWLPSGRFAVTATNQYRVWLAGNPTSVLAERDVPVIPVSEDERADALERLTEEVRSVEGGESLRIPEFPHVKPALRGVSVADDGRILVLVSMPSDLRDGEWTEPLAYDVFDQDGSFTARIVLPDDFFMHVLRDDLLWGIARDSLGVQSIRRYRITWP